MLRSAFVSMIQSVVQSKRTQGYTLQQLADDTNNNKSTVSRWFSEEVPNWQVDTIADIVDALNVELVLRVRDRETGALHSPQGIVEEESVTRGSFQVYRRKNVLVYRSDVGRFDIDIPTVYRSSERAVKTDVVSITTLPLQLP